MKRTDAELLTWLEAEARRSPSGLSIEWVPPQDGLRGGYRFMRHHWIGEPQHDLREALQHAVVLTESGLRP